MIKKIFFGDKEETLETQKSCENQTCESLFDSGIKYYKCNGSIAITDTWSSTLVGQKCNINTYLTTSNLEIKNLYSKINGIYITNYVVTDNFLNNNIKELVVYYIGVNNKNRIKVTYKNNFDCIKVELA
jgi:hypothetical protein